MHIWNVYRIEAEAAEEKYDEAIKTQFGPKATRWDHNPSEYNNETEKAYQAKIAASTKLAAVNKCELLP